MSISIGTVELQGFEVPSTIHYGGSQRIATHHLADGRRTYDLLGAEEFNIQFSGLLAGPTAVARSQELEQMRRQGQQTTLRWSGFAIPVMLNHLTLEYSTDSWIRYSISCFVIDDTLPATDTVDAINLVSSASPFENLDKIDGIDARGLKTLVDDTRIAISNNTKQVPEQLVHTRLDAADARLTKAIERAEQSIEQDAIAALHLRGDANTARTLAHLVRARAILRSLQTMLQMEHR